MNYLLLYLLIYLLVFFKLNNFIYSALIDNRNVIILIDNPLLATFPFEAFSVFSQAKLVSRDFSFGFLLKRLQSQKLKSLRRKDINCITNRLIKK